MMHLNRGIFDEASVSMICSTTVNEIGKLAATPPDVRRFRPNIVDTQLIDEWLEVFQQVGTNKQAERKRLWTVKLEP